jgi:hypothetical protein
MEGDMYGISFQNMDELRLVDFVVSAPGSMVPNDFQVVYKVWGSSCYYNVLSALTKARKLWEYEELRKEQARIDQDTAYILFAQQMSAAHHWADALHQLDKVSRETEEVVAVRAQIVASQQIWAAQVESYKKACKCWREEMDAACVWNSAWIASRQKNMVELAEEYMIQRIGIGVFVNDGWRMEICKEWTLPSSSPVFDSRYSRVLEDGKIVNRSYTIPVYSEEPISVTPVTAPQGTVQAIEIDWPEENPQQVFRVFAHPLADAEMIRGALVAGLLPYPAEPALPAECVLTTSEISLIRFHPVVTKSIE